MPLIPTRSIEAAGEIDGVLAGQRIGDEQRLVRLCDVADRNHLVHQRLIDMLPPGGIEHQHVEAAAPRLVQGPPGDVQRLLALDDRQGVDPDLASEDRELLLGGRPRGVEGGHQHPLALHAP